MMAGKVVGLGFEIISKLDSYFLMTVPLCSSDFFLISLEGGHCLRVAIIAARTVLPLKNNCLT